MSKAERRLVCLKERYDLNSRIIARPDRKIFVCNLNRRSISRGVWSNAINWFLRS